MYITLKKKNLINKIKIKEIYVLKDIYLYKKTYSLRKLVVVVIFVISGKIFIRYINIQLLYLPWLLP